MPWVIFSHVITCPSSDYQMVVFARKTIIILHLNYDTVPRNMSGFGMLPWMDCVLHLHLFVGLFGHHQSAI